MSESHAIKIIFPDKETKLVFATWMSDGGGEQDFAAVCENEGCPIKLGLSYHGPESEQYPTNNRRRYGEFLSDDTIRVKRAPEEA